MDIYGIYIETPYRILLTKIADKDMIWNVSVFLMPEKKPFELSILLKNGQGTKMELDTNGALPR